LKRLYDADARGLQDLELCEEVGCALFARCETFELVRASRVRCPGCRTVFGVAREGVSACPSRSCDFSTSFPDYRASVRRHYAWPGRGGDAFAAFHRQYPAARTYAQKIVLIDQLIHSFHIDEKRGAPVKSVASKLLEGNKKGVVRFLDELSARDPEAKQAWRSKTAATIDARVLDDARKGTQQARPRAQRGRPAERRA
jgi:hypothetical protein